MECGAAQEDEVALLLSGLVDNKGGFGGKGRGESTPAGLWLCTTKVSLLKLGVVFFMRPTGMLLLVGQMRWSQGRTGNDRVSPAEQMPLLHQASLPSHPAWNLQPDCWVQEEADLRSPGFSPVLRDLAPCTIVPGQLKESAGRHLPSGDGHRGFCLRV